MIQRIQSLFLIFVILGMAAYLFLPFWIKTDPSTGDQVVFTAWFLKEASASGPGPAYHFFPYILGGIFAVITMVTSGFEIFRYKNRLTQIKLGMVNSILMSLILFFSAWLAIHAQKNLLPGALGAFKPGLFAPVFSMLFNALANRFIKKDEDLVRSADRIR